MGASCSGRMAVLAALWIAAALMGCGPSSPADPWAHLQRQADAGRATPTDLVRLGEHRAEQGQTLEAFELALRARKADPSFSGSHHLLGILYMQAQEAGKARAALRKALEVDPSLVSAQLNLARLEIAERKPVAALTLLREVLKAERTNAYAWLLTGQAQQMRGSPQRAAASFRQAVALDRNLGEAYAAHGSLDLELGAYQRAIPPLERAYGLGVRSPATLIHFATALVAGRGTPADVARAEALVKEAGTPGTPAAKLASGLIHQQKGDYLEARAAYEAVLRSIPRHERALYGLGETLRLLGARERSLEVLGQYDRIVKQRQRLRTLEDRLNQQGDRPELGLLRRYAIGLYDAEQYDQAALHFQTWVARAPADAEAKQWLKRAREKGRRP